ncbi:glycosyltransferase family A protein [Crenobacter sp. SG2305]|uniref:glycosyltransferase family A protein n=1 Tax=Crenobacter oryzisoli TaxID=3056844 RepID=UPI0025AA6239|nr:glycosyltransferase family A protein [Crenobacter sp. SG2305]MDN0081259.1 glycosyltransferase family A protein [Crenobacter sp. SG2305]
MSAGQDKLDAVVVVLSLEDQPASGFIDLIQNLVQLPTRYRVRVVAKQTARFDLPSECLATAGGQVGQQLSALLSERVTSIPHVIVCDGTAALEAAVRFKQANPWPTALVVHRDQKTPFEKTRRNRWLQDKMVSVNLMPTLAHNLYYSKFTQGHPDGNSPLPLNNPVILEQPRFDGKAERTLDYTLEALLTGNRQPPWLGKPKLDYSHIRLSYVTYFYINQKSPDTVYQLLEHYSKYPPELLDQIQFVLVDDGSPLEYEPRDYGLNITWVKVDEDIPWNMAGARNLGFLYAKSENVILTDVDHAFPVEVLQELVKKRPVGKQIYRFWRRDDKGAYYGAHPNVFLLARSRFFRFFGYDEEFAGAYGADDTRFVKFQKAQGTRAWRLPKRFWCYEREVDRDNSYHTLVRDLSFNTGADSRKRLELDYFGGDERGHTRNFLDFKWHVSLNHQRTPTPRPLTPRRGWKLRWLLRQLLPNLNP